MTAPIDRMINAVVRCTLCGKPPGCGCWVQCACGWWFQRGMSCHNPNCEDDA